MRKGIVQYYLEQKGYGYIRDPKTREEFFFKKKHLQTEVYDKARVRFEVGENRHGLYACNIRLEASL
ncbi:MAG TPA: cold shock domain-containing protein [Saprospiraceae bacterium]|nr:cold shock domain-containing protein [Saprospiraceae bacterium]